MNKMPRLVALCAFIYGPLALASPPESSPSTSAAAQIAPQPLADALTAFSRQSGLQVIYASEVVAGRRSDGAPAGLPVADALKRILAGTGLTFTWINDRTVSIWVANDQHPSVDVATQERTLRLSKADTQAENAGEAAKAANSNGQASQPDDQLQEIMVTGVRERGYRSKTQSAAMFGEQSILDTPFQVSVFPIELLQDQQVRTLFHVSKNDASTVVADGSSGFYDALQVRGFYLGNRTNYFREGLLFENNTQAVFENKAALEIVKGLTALRYGFTAPGGIVNFVLKRPTEEAYRFIDVFGDSYGGHGVHVDIGGKLSEDVGIRFNSAIAHEGFFVDGVDGKRQMASVFMTWTPTEDLLFEADMEYQSRAANIGQSLRLNNFDPSLTAAQQHSMLDRYDRRNAIGEEWTEFPTKSLFQSVRASYQFTPDWNLKISAHRMNLDRTQYALSVAGGSLTANGDYIANLYFEPDQQRNNETIEATVTGKLHTGGVQHEIALGAYNNKTSIYGSNGFFGPVGTKNIFDPSVRLADPNPPASSSFYVAGENWLGLYASDYMRITDRLNVLAGVRYSQPESKHIFGQALPPGPGLTPLVVYDETAVTPSGGIIFKPRQNISIYASYAEGIEYGGTAPLGTVNFNEVLPPLQSVQYEVGIKADLFDGASISAAVFEIEKGLEYIDAGNRYVQDGRQVHRGVEASLTGDVTDALRLVSSVQYLDAKLKKTGNGAFDGLEPVSVPELQVSGYASWRLPMKPNLAVNLGAFYSAEKFADNLNTFKVDDYVRFDTGVRYGFKMGRTDATLRLVVENIADTNYIAGTSFGFFYFGPPRTFRMSLSASY